MSGMKSRLRIVLTTVVCRKPDWLFNFQKYYKIIKKEVRFLDQKADLFLSSLRNTCIFRHEIHAQSEARLLLEYNFREE